MGVLALEGQQEPNTINTYGGSVVSAETSLSQNGMRYPGTGLGFYS